MMSKRIKKAQVAFKKNDINLAKDAHTKSAIHENLDKHENKGKYVGDLVYGALDGIVTTFAVVSGVEGAKLSSSVVLVMGLANLFADGVSMAFGNYLSTKSEIEYIKREKEREKWEIEHLPEGEREEIRQIYIRKGFTGKILENVVSIITSDKDVWVDTMMSEELGLNADDKTPVKSGLATLFAFLVAGFIPLVSFVLATLIPGFGYNKFAISVILTGITLFTVGAMRTKVTGIKWYRAGFEMFIVGGLAASIAYIIGFALRGLV